MTPNSTPIASLLQSLRSVFLPKAMALEQYPARPLVVPESYLRAHQAMRSQTLPLISIVTPSYNQGEFIERTIRSILNQEYPYLEYIVQDGNSKDGTRAVLKYYEDKLTYFEMRKDNGQAHAVNLGFGRTKGEIMSYLNSDDILLPGSLWYVADYFSYHPEVDVVYGHRIIINEKDQEVGRWVLPPHDDDVISWNDYVPQETLFWRRSLWEKIGGYIDESYQFALDWDLIIRFKDAGANFKRLPRFLGAFRFRAEQKTNMQMNSIGINEMNRLRKKVHGHEISWQEVNKNICSYLIRSEIYHRLHSLGILRY